VQQHAIGLLVAAAALRDPGRLFEHNSAGDGNTCWATTWQIDVNADTITGSCFAYKNDHTSLAFEWNLRRLGGASSG
jgi:hypothetical protein